MNSGLYGAHREVTPRSQYNIYWPEEDACAGPARVGVGGGGPHGRVVHLRLAAVALRAQHGTTHQTHGGRPAVVTLILGTPTQDNIYNND